MFKNDETTDESYDEDGIDDYDSDLPDWDYFKKIDEELEKDDVILDKFTHFLQVLLAICIVIVLCLIAWVYSSLEIM